MVQRLYHFTGAKHALSNIEKNRIKVAQIAALNDPFDLRAPRLNSRAERQKWEAWRAYMDSNFGILCFSPHWKNVTMWSHYADKHKGICLGFDLSDELATEIKYAQTRPPIDLSRSPTEEDLQPLLFLKSTDWEYEEEWRVLINLNKPPTFKDGDFYFHPIDAELKLVEVVVGPMCDVNREKLEPLIKNYKHAIDLQKARLAFQSFKIVTQKLGLG